MRSPLGRLPMPTAWLRRTGASPPSFPALREFDRPLPQAPPSPTRRERSNVKIRVLSLSPCRGEEWKRGQIRIHRTHVALINHPLSNSDRQLETDCQSYGRTTLDSPVSRCSLPKILSTDVRDLRNVGSNW